MDDINIGNKIKEFRKLKNMGLRDLADKANMSASMLSQVENNSVNPSINTLKNIANVLNIPLFKFFQESERREGFIVRKDEYPIIGISNEEVQYKLLTKNPNTSLECCLMDIPAKSASSDFARGHEGEEVAFVISGEVDILVDEQKYHLNEGDAINIPPLSPHRWINNSDNDIRIMFAVTPPRF